MTRPVEVERTLAVGRNHECGDTFEGALIKCCFDGLEVLLIIGVRELFVGRAKVAGNKGDCDECRVRVSWKNIRADRTLRKFFQIFGPRLFECVEFAARK